MKTYEYKTVKVIVRYVSMYVTYEISYATFG